MGDEQWQCRLNCRAHGSGHCETAAKHADCYVIGQAERRIATRNESTTSMLYELLVP